MAAPVHIPVSVFTAGHGYAWSAQPAGIGREAMDELYRIATAGRDAFADDATPTTGIASDGKTAKDTRTPQQKAALVKLAKQLCSMYGLKETDVYGHYQFAAKACPSFKIEPFRAEMKA